MPTASWNGSRQVEVVSDDPDDDRIRRAIVAYFRYGSRRRPAPPFCSICHILEYDGLHYVRLANANGCLAVYRITAQGALRLLRRPPVSVEAFGA